MLAASVFMAAVMLAVRGTTEPGGAHLVQLGIDAAVGAAAYWAALRVLRVEAYRDVLALARRGLRGDWLEEPRE